jgi:uncharacterized protein YecE (DUF72 family)
MSSGHLAFRLGCAVWSYKAWSGSFFPAGSRATNFLHLYGERMTTVEGNTTFYSSPSPAMVDRWVQATPDRFRFCPKLPRTVTHQGLLCPHLSEALAFLSLMQRLGNRLGPVFAQLPPSYSPAAFQDLADFLTGWPRQHAPLALEVRHLDWFQPSQRDRLNRLLVEQGVGRVLLDTRPIYETEDHDPQLGSERRKPRVPLQLTVTAPFTLVRYISHPDLRRNDPYLEQWVRWVKQQLAEGNQIYFFVHCPVEAHSPAIARHFQARLEMAQVPVPPLPWNQLDTPPEQLTLF